MAMTHTLVLIADPARADLHDSIVSSVRDALTARGIAPGVPTWLAERIAADIPFGGDPAAANAVARATVKSLSIDANVVANASRRKKLLVADMESTLIENEFLDDIGTRAGLGDRITEITRRAMAGELDFAGALRERVAMLKDKPATLLEEVYAGLKVTPGAKTLVATMRRDGALTAIVSGGFRFFVSRVGEILGTDTVEANDLNIADAVLAGTVKEPIFDRTSKRLTLEKLAASCNLAMAETMAVGDGANDIEMVRMAGLGVAFRAKQVLADAADAAVMHGDLTALLYLQGYRRIEFAA